MTAGPFTVIEGGKSDPTPDPLQTRYEQMSEAMKRHEVLPRTPEQLVDDLRAGLNHAALTLAWVGTQTTYAEVASTLRSAAEAAEQLAALDAPPGAA